MYVCAFVSMYMCLGVCACAWVCVHVCVDVVCCVCDCKSTRCVCESAFTCEDFDNLNVTQFYRALSGPASRR